MKKLTMLLMTMLFMAMAIPEGAAQEITITLLPGWTWISCPMTEAVDFATALGDFTPMTGDAIKSQWGNAYYKNGRWAGSISEFYPGYGYKYYSNRPTPVTVTFNAQQPSSQVVVSTSEPMLITGNSAMGGGEVTTTDGTYILVRGLCWATHENPTTNDDNFLEEGSGVGSFSATMTGLNWSTTYYYRAYAVTPSGTVYGEQQSFTTRDGIPTLTTTDITNITAISSTSGGNITDNGGLSVTARGVCWSTSPNPTVSDSHTTNGTGTGIFTSNITGLEISMTYYVRAYATTNAGTAYGNELTFTTRDGIPTVTTAEVTDIQGETATCGGNVTDNCGLTVTTRGVCWSTSPNPTLDDSHTTNGSGMGSFSSSITGMSISTTYYVRAYATTSAGTGYGEQVSFTTRNGIPTVTTVEVTNIGSGWAYSGGNITDNGGLAVTARGVCWSTSPSPTLANSHTTNGSGAGSFSSYMTGLTMSTTYYVRAYATNSFVTVYGNQLNFTTADDYVYVDLGLPSGTLWATCNVGANSPEDYGDYFAWGETQPKDTYNWSTYQYSNGGTSWENPNLTKYCNNSSYGYNGFTDNLTTLLPEDDAATANWGDGWRMPTETEWWELYNNTTHTWTTLNGVSGMLFTANNGNNLFWPANGWRDGGNLYGAGSNIEFIGSSLNTENPSAGWGGELFEDGYILGGTDRCFGMSVRAVRNFPPVATYVVTEITATSALVGGHIINNSEVSESGICYRTEQGEETCIAIPAANNVFLMTLTNLTPYTTYYVRAYATNEVGTSYGEEMSFTTIDGINNPIGAINGMFSVSSSQKVFFSQGNLQYQASTNTWRFAENQFDYVGSANRNISSSYSGWIDLFGWGTSGYNHGAIAYRPWSTSQTSSNYYAYGNSSYNLYDQTGKADWGYNPISNGGNQSGQWRTLTSEEWVYVFDTRHTPSGIRYAKAIVNGVNGVILLPDDWSTNNYSLSNANSSSASFGSNVITIAVWNTLEQLGAVFMPSSGFRRGSSVDNVGSDGYYWSSSIHNNEYACFANFDASWIAPTCVGHGRCDGFSIRLVTNIGN